MSAFEEVKKCIDFKHSFVLEAGAGSGKTYTLIQTLNMLIEEYGEKLIQQNQQIVCITYTNVAKNEIIERLENNPLVLIATIHEFLWGTINSFQTQLKEQLCRLNEIYIRQPKLLEPLSRHGFSTPNLYKRISCINEVLYNDSSFRNFEEGQLHHDDIIFISKLMLKNYKMLANIYRDKYPFILVDEYQDMARETAASFINYILKRNPNNIVLGFYGDSHQKIYKSGIGSLKHYIDNGKLLEIKKEENYRSSTAIVNLLNRFRTNIKQIPYKKPPCEGTIKFLYYINPPKEQRLNNKGKLVNEKISDYEKRIQPYKNDIYDKVVSKLELEKWDIHNEKSEDKILVLANSRVAARAGFGKLYKIFSTRYETNAKARLIDREHPIVKLLVGSYDKQSSIERETGIEHLIQFWENNMFNHIINFLAKNGELSFSILDYHNKKKEIADTIKELKELREMCTVKDVIDYITRKGIMKMPDSVVKIQEKVNIDIDTYTDEKEMERATKDKVFYDDLMQLEYKQFIRLFEHTQNYTVFSTKHGTKGEEYRNVFALLDDTEWKQEYNFDKYFDNTDDNNIRNEMTKNLFYVTCSRAKENLVVLMLSPLSEVSLNNIERWFGKENVKKVEDYLSI